MFRFFFETNQVNAKGETFDRIFIMEINEDGLKLNKEDAETAINYMNQVMRAVREVMFEMIRLQDYPDYNYAVSFVVDKIN